MLKVKENSWHFKLYCFHWNLLMGDSPFVPFILLARKASLNKKFHPTSLCKYFWFNLLFSLGFPLYTVLIVVGTILLAIIVGVVFPFFMLGKLIHDVHAKHSAKKKMKRKLEVKTEYETKEREPSLFFEFIKAKKRKLCPLIEVVRDDG